MPVPGLSLLGLKRIRGFVSILRYINPTIMIIIIIIQNSYEGNYQFQIHKGLYSAIRSTSDNTECPYPVILSVSSNTKCIHSDIQSVCTTMLWPQRYE